nr:SDR family oxidoreductase [Thermoleophilum album]
MLTMRGIEGRVAVVTGGASGIGAATCRRLAEEGARVAVVDIDMAGAERVAHETGGRPYRCDVADVDQVRATVGAVERELGAVDLLVNNAGTDEFGFLVETRPEQWDRVLAINLRGVIACTHAVLAGMQERRFGRIVNVASEAGRVGSRGSSVYSAAKAGVIGFTKAVAREGARYGVTCNAVAPGPIETPLLMAAPEHLGERGRKLIETMVGSTALRRIGRPEEVAGAIVFLLSDDASYITGETLGVSGGLGMV